MEAKLNRESFSDIFENSLPGILTNLPGKSFNNCIKDMTLPYLSESEKECIKMNTLKYLYSVDHTLIYFSKKLII